MVRPGRPVRLELNAQRVTLAIRFYRELFGWTSRPLHVGPWGSIPLIANGARVFGNEFMAMGAFAQPRWLIWCSADLERAEAAVRAGGGDVGQGVHTLGGLGRLLDAYGPDGMRIAAIELAEVPPEEDAPGDPCLVEVWGKGVSGQAGFCADVFGLECVATERGAVLTDAGMPRIFFRDVPFDLPAPTWVPYFRSTGVGGDCERARRLGAIVQVHTEIVEGLGEVAVLADPAGAYFGLVDPGKAG
ncbi:MAG: hypothetical protein AAFY59_05675 [Pseudomonadota bacterium]